VMHGVLSGARAGRSGRGRHHGNERPIGGAFDCTRARFRVLQDEGAADLSREAAGPRAMHLLPFVRHASAAAAAFAGSAAWNDEDARKNFEASSASWCRAASRKARSSRTRSPRRPAAISFTAAASTGTRKTIPSGRH